MSAVLQVVRPADPADSVPADAGSALTGPVEAGACVSVVEEPVVSAGLVCSACGRDRMPQAASKRGWRLVRCQSCGTVRVWPQPATSQVAALYSKSAGYFATSATRLETTSPTGAHAVHELLVSAGTSGRRLLDVGCGNGQLIHHLRPLGWQVCGVDLNADAAALARENDLEVVTGDLSSCPWPEASLDAVHMGDLIEHVPDPIDTLRQAFRLLRANGLLLVRTPNADCSFATATLGVLGRLGLSWPYSEAPYHLHEFTPRGLLTLVRRAGFEVVCLQCAGRTPFWYTLGGLGWFDGLKACMKRTGRYRFDWRLVPAFPRLAVAASILLPFHLYALAADRLRCTGRAITLLARRPFVPVQTRKSDGATLT
jgi:SAM-dependent methyltransferase